MQVGGGVRVGGGMLVDTNGGVPQSATHALTYFKYHTI